MVIGQIRITKNGLQGFNLDKTITHFTNAGKKSSNFRVFLLVFSILLNEHGKFNGPFLRVSLKSANFFLTWQNQGGWMIYLSFYYLQRCYVEVQNVT